MQQRCPIGRDGPDSALRWKRGGAGGQPDRFKRRGRVASSSLVEQVPLTWKHCAPCPAASTTTSTDGWWKAPTKWRRPADGKRGTASRASEPEVRPRWWRSKRRAEWKPTIESAIGCTCSTTPWIDSAPSCPLSRKRRNSPRSKRSALRTTTFSPSPRRWDSSNRTDTIRPEASRSVSKTFQFNCVPKFYKIPFPFKRWASVTWRWASATKAVPSHPPPFRITLWSRGIITAAGLYFEAIHHPAAPAPAPPLHPPIPPKTFSASLSISWPNRNHLLPVSNSSNPGRSSSWTLSSSSSSSQAGPLS